MITWFMQLSGPEQMAFLIMATLIVLLVLTVRVQLQRWN